MAVFVDSRPFKALEMSFTTNRATFVFASTTVIATPISFTCWTQSNLSQRISSELTVTWDSSRQAAKGCSNAYQWAAGLHHHCKSSIFGPPPLGRNVRHHHAP